MTAENAAPTPIPMTLSMAEAVRIYRPKLESFKNLLKLVNSDIFAVERYLQSTLAFLLVEVGSGIEAPKPENAGNNEDHAYMLKWMPDSTGTFRIFCSTAVWDPCEKICESDIKPLAEASVRLRLLLHPSLPTLVRAVADRASEYEHYLHSGEVPKYDLEPLSP